MKLKSNKNEHETTLGSGVTNEVYDHLGFSNELPIGAAYILLSLEKYEINA